MAAPGNGGWQRRYPPLFGSLTVLATLMLLLPNALTLPQSQPPATLEFATVPQNEQQANPDTGGSVSSLGLGSSDTAPEPSTPDPTTGPGLPPPPPPVLAGDRPLTKRCVGSPPRQTEDPLAPPCVGFYEGDNGGSTSPGVTSDEIRVVIYSKTNCTRVTSAGAENCAPMGFYDLDKDNQDEDVLIRLSRSLNRYFNERYQTYGRRVHFIVQTEDDDPNDGDSPEKRTKDATEALSAYDPYAVVGLAWPNAINYLRTMTEVGRVAFTGAGSTSGVVGFSEDQLRRNPGLLWSYPPTIERRAASVADLICTQVVNRPVSYSGNNDIGQPRKLGFMSTSDATRIDLVQYGKLIKEGITDCGGVIEKTGTYPQPACETGCTADPATAIQNMAAFQQAGVTTVIWAGGADNRYSTAAASINYRPEWLIADDGAIAVTDTASFQDQSVWQHARAVTGRVVRAPVDQQPCVRAIWEADPTVQGADLELACDLYAAYRQVFIGIQVAGPDLNPTSMSRGLHAIPPYDADTVTTPACFYEAGDFSCVKDATTAIWDPNGPGTYSGCWRADEGGKRHRVGAWPDRDIDAVRDLTGPCLGGA